VMGLTGRSVTSNAATPTGIAAVPSVSSHQPPVLSEVKQCGRLFAQLGPLRIPDIARYFSALNQLRATFTREPGH